MEVDNETQSVVDFSIADQEFTSIVPAVYQALFNTPVVAPKSWVSCDSLIYVSGKIHQDTTDAFFEFNPIQPCSQRMPDGKPRTGKISVRFRGYTNTPQIILKLKGYYADGVQYSCDSLIVTVDSSTDSSAVLEAKLVNGFCQGSDFTIKYRFDKMFTVYPKINGRGSGRSYIYGSSSGTNRLGLDFSTNTDQTGAWAKNLTCRYVESGRMTLTPKGFKQRMVDFGKVSNCDDLATFTVNENTVAFKLK